MTGASGYAIRRVDDLWCHFDSVATSRGSFCPPAILSHCELENVLVGEGCVMRHSSLRNAVLGSNCFVDSGCLIEDTILIGNGFITNVTPSPPLSCPPSLHFHSPPLPSSWAISLTCNSTKLIDPYQ